MTQRLNIPKILFVSAPPGIGKTQAAVMYMARHVERGLNNKHPGYLFYVFPTLDLGLQTFNNLKAIVPKRHHDSFLFFVEASADGDHTDKRRTETKVYDILDGCANRGRAGDFHAQPFLQGSILFMTHKTFLKLRKNPAFEKTTVIFDEARSWVMDADEYGRKLKANRVNDKAHRTYMRALFEEEPLLVRGPNGLEQHKYICKLTPKYVPPNRRAKLWSKSNGSDKPIQATATSLFLDELHNQLSARSGDTIRMQAFSFRQGTNFIQLAMPHYPFIGFKRVLILAADFERSQMYHLLNKEHANIKDYTETFINKYGKYDYDTALKRIRERYKKLEITPLLQESGVSSKLQLATGIVLPEYLMLNAHEMLNQFNMTTAALRDVVRLARKNRHDGIGMRPHHHAVLKNLEDMGAHYDVLAWQKTQVEKIVPEFRSRKGNSCKLPAVLVVNKTYADIDVKDHEYVSMGKVEGNNEYRNTNVVTFLATCNPNPAVAQLLRAQLSDTDYDPDEDYVINKAIQSIGRGNIRKHKSKKSMLAIVSTQGIADRVKARMGGYPTVTNYARETGYCFWSTVSVSKQLNVDRSPEDEKKRNRERQQKHKEANPLNKKLASLRAYRSQLRKQVEQATDKKRRKQLQEKLDLKEMEIKQIEKQRTKEQ